MTTANEVRGEFDIVLAGSTYPLRPSFSAIMAFEKITDRSLLQLADDAQRGRLDLMSMAAVVSECVAAWGREAKVVSAQGWDLERTAGMIMEADGGALIASKQLSIMLFMAATGGVSASGEAKPAPAAKPVEASVAKTRSPRREKSAVG